MIKVNPRVTIGMPVYNAAQYLAETIDCFLSQTYTDFELIISDNASEDDTAAICRAYAAQDARIRYVRNVRNLGAALNYNQLVDLARGAYFKWAAHDDLCAHDYLEKCVAVLDRDPTVLIAHTLTAIIDEHGQFKHDYNDLLNFRSAVPHERFYNYLFRPAAEWNAIFGLMRTEVLAVTPRIGNYIASDQTLLGELVLRGKVYQVQERLFFRRDHPQNSWRASRSSADLAAWFNPATRRQIRMPTKWRHLLAYLRSIWRVPMSLSDRLWCSAYMLKWTAKNLVWPFQKRWRSYRAARPRAVTRQTG